MGDVHVGLIEVVAVEEDVPVAVEAHPGIGVVEDARAITPFGFRMVTGLLAVLAGAGPQRAAVAGDRELARVTEQAARRRLRHAHGKQDGGQPCQEVVGVGLRG